jgi:glutathione S-transferase
MFTLYYSPGACSMASHIALEEIGAPYEAKQTSIARGEHRTDAYLRINPRGKVPALCIDGQVLTENTAILTYLAKRFPDRNLLPSDPLEEARCISTMAWLSNTVHPAYRQTMRPERFAEDAAAHDAVRETGRKTFLASCREIDSLLEGGEWMMGRQYTVADPYALVFYGWGVRSGLPVNALGAYTAWKDRMLERPAVRRILDREKNVLLG